ncbi:MAG TPA: TetR/AcrR family transcriptional regulator [Deltaproteobacteria bacterium]|nr:TetR/AcrR family transcriptional regulator [Deltaproteobacteria bacterium]
MSQIASRADPSGAGRSRKPSVPDVRPPRRLLSPGTERALTTRQLEILDTLDESVLSGGFADLTMAEIARRMTCSLRTLYGIAPSKEELVLAVVDRRLHRIGREAMEALELDGPPLERLRAYLRATNLALQPTTVLFSRDFAKLPGALQLAEAHAGYIVSVTRALLDEAVASGAIAPLDTSALALVLGRLGREFARPELESLIEESPRETADAIAEIILAGLVAGR